MHFVALRGPKSKKLLPQTQTKIKFGTKYQILGFSVSKSYFGSLRNLLSTLLTVIQTRIDTRQKRPSSLDTSSSGQTAGLLDVEQLCSGSHRV